MSVTKQSNVEKVVQDINDTFDGRVTKLEEENKDSSKSESNDYRFYCDVCCFGASKSQNYRQHVKTKRHLENVEHESNKKVKEATLVTSNISYDNSGLKSKTEEVENPKIKNNSENADQETSLKSADNSGLKARDIVALNSKKTGDLPNNVESKLNADIIENYCEVCNLKVNNKYNYDLHLKSKKHFKNVSQNNDANKNSNVNPVNDAPASEKPKLVVINHDNHDKKQDADLKVKDSVGSPTVVKLSDKVKDIKTPIVASDVVTEPKIGNESGLNCPECNKSFGTKSNLNLHMNIHKSVKPFSCLKCDKTFAQKNNLKIHEEKCASQNLDVPISKTSEKSELERKPNPELVIKTKSVPQSKLNEVPISVKSINVKTKSTETSETKLDTQYHASVKPVTQIKMQTIDNNLDASQIKSKLNTTSNQPQVNNAQKSAKEINPDKISALPTVSKHTLENSKFSKNISSTTTTKSGVLGNSKYNPISPGNIWGMNKETEWTNMSNVFQSFKADKVNNATPILFKKIEVFQKPVAVTEKPFQMFGKNVPQTSDSNIPQVFGSKVPPAAQVAKPLRQEEIPVINFDDIKDKDDDDEEVELECKDCMEAFWFKYQLHSHFKEVHGVDDPEAYENRKRQKEQKEMPRFVQKPQPYVQKQKPVIQAFVVENSNNAMRFVCEVCNLTFNDKRSLTRHLETKKHEDNKMLKNSQQNQKDLNTNKQVNPQQIPNANTNPNLNQNMNTNTRLNLHEIPPIQNKITAPQQVSAQKRPLPLSNKEREEAPVRKIAKPNKSESFILVDDEDNDFVCKFAGCMETFWYQQQLKDHVAKAHN